jgi:hypothetical protein
MEIEGGSTRSHCVENWLWEEAVDLSSDTQHDDEICNIFWLMLTHYNEKKNVQFSLRLYCY